MIDNKLEKLEILSIPDFPGYYAGKDGYIYSDRRGEIKKLSDRFRGGRSDRQGYLCVCLYKDKKPYNLSVHRLIAEIFLHKDDNKNQVDHINNIITDNRLENLRWITQSDNIKNKRIPSKSNRSGITGVYRMNNKTHPYWVSHWTDFNGKLLQKLFSVNIHGEKYAKELAINYRKKMENIYYKVKLD